MLLAADALEKDGIHCRLISMHTVKPLDTDCIFAAANETGALVVLEEHSANGGLGGAVAKLMDAGIQPRKFLRLALPDRYISQVGSHEWLLDQYGLAAPKTEASVRKLLDA